MMPHPRLDLARSTIYDAALDPGGWAAVLDVVESFVGAHSGAVFVGSWEERSALVHAPHRLDQELWQAWRERLIAIDKWSGALAGLPDGFVATGNGILERRELERSEFYNEHLAPRGIEDVLCVSLARHDGMHSVLSLYRHQPFDAHEVDLLARLAPDLRIATRLQQQLGDLRARAERAEQALEHVPVAVLLLDAKGRVTHANAAARALLARGDGLSSVRGRVACARPSDDTRLHAALARVAAEAAQQQRTGATLAVSRGVGRRPLGVLLAALPPRTAARTPVPCEPGDGSTVMMTVSDPEQALALPARVLQEQFGLTPAQARLASALAARESLEHYAHRAGMTMNTARSTLKVVFAKTGTGRQAELVLVLAASVAGLARSGPDE